MPAKHDVHTSTLWKAEAGGHKFQSHPGNSARHGLKIKIKKGWDCRSVINCPQLLSPRMKTNKQKTKKVTTVAGHPQEKTLESRKVM